MKNFLQSIKIILFIVVLFKLSGCSENPPIALDGTSDINLMVLWNLNNNSSECLGIANAKVIISSEYGLEVKYTDKDGKLILNNIPSSTYSFSITAKCPLDSNIILTGTLESLHITAGNTIIDTVFVKMSSKKGIVINELYYCGPVNDFQYYYDQFIELYNSSDLTKYLDGCYIIRMTSPQSGYGSIGWGVGIDEENDGDIDSVNYIFKFPGNPGETNFPIKPRSFLVIASDAINHSRFSKNAVNLENADWEFYNQYSPEDIDNPNVPNLLILKPEKTKDFTMNLTNDVIILADGTDKNWSDGMDINSILDGVEYEYKFENSKSLDPRVDRGHFLGSGRFSGKSAQRYDPGADSNNSLLDWTIIDHPTPGYQ